MGRFFDAVGNSSVFFHSKSSFSLKGCVSPNQNCCDSMKILKKMKRCIYRNILCSAMDLNENSGAIPRSSQKWAKIKFILFFLKCIYPILMNICNFFICNSCIYKANFCYVFLCLYCSDRPKQCFTILPEPKRTSRLKFCFPNRNRTEPNM